MHIPDPLCLCAQASYGQPEESTKLLELRQMLRQTEEDTNALAAATDRMLEFLRPLQQATAASSQSSHPLSPGTPAQEVLDDVVSHVLRTALNQQKPFCSLLHLIEFCRPLAGAQC